MQLTDALLAFILNLMVVIVIVRGFYYPHQRDKQYVFTLIVFNTLIFFVVGLLKSGELSVGAGFGLFAIFSILRYRTDTIPIREMTYLFILTALGVINALLFNTSSYAEFVLVNVAVIVVLLVLEKGWGFQYDARKVVIYERIDLIRPENHGLLLADLQERLGLPIRRIEIGTLNFLRDTAKISVYYDASAIQTSTVHFTADSLSIGSDSD